MKGRVVLVRFPFDDLSTTKVRPAVCLTGTIGEHDHIVLAFITSRLPATILPSDIVIDPARPNLSATGLRVQSTLRLHRLMTVSRDVILRELGRIPSSVQRQIDEKLRQLFRL